MIDRAIALYGTAEPVPERTLLTAGPVTATLENGALRWISLGGVEVLRGIAFLVRDRNWSTPSPTITDLNIAQDADGFRVSFQALCHSDDGELPWSAEIVGVADGSLRFTGTAAPKADFATNRTGFVILHPLERVVGCPVDVTHVDGSKRRARFPDLVDPEQCFFNVRALSHEAAPGVWATCTMVGDAWEMEDHRNWLDASFKTYVRPLSLPYPYTIKGGERVTQTVTLVFSGASPTSPKTAGEAPVQIALGGGTTRMPAIGLRAPLQWMDQAMAAADLAREAGPRLLNARFDPRAGHGGQELRQLGALASAVGAGLTLELVVPGRQDPAEELNEFAAQLKGSGIQPESIVVAIAEDRIRLEPGAPPPPLALLGAVHQAARAAFPGIRIGGGSFGFFTELNRNWPPIGLIDYVAHVVCSTVHASDDRAMMENLESFRHMTKTVRAFAGNLPYRLVASGIGLDIGPYGPPTPNPDNTRRTMVRMDPRHRGLFGAAWCLASIAEAARGGLEAISPAALAGEFGIVHRRLTYDQPWFDGLDRVAIYPIYHVVRGMARAAGKPCIEAMPSDRTRIAALGCRDAHGGVDLWLANRRDTPQQVRLPDLGPDVQLSRLDETTFEAAATDPAFLQSSAKPCKTREIEIGAYGIAWIQSGG